MDCSDQDGRPRNTRTAAELDRAADGFQLEPDTSAEATLEAGFSDSRGAAHRAVSDPAAHVPTTPALAEDFPL